MQKTAYDMRISDWSSDVCSSDLDMVVRLSDAMRKDIEGLSTLLIPVPALVNGNAEQIGFIALSEVATLDLVLGPNQVSRENGKRLVRSEERRVGKECVSTCRYR